MMTTASQLFQVISPGSFTTVQDRGRYGYQRYGVPVSGVIDPSAATIANLLVGNGDEAAVLECTVTGPTLQVLAPATVAVTGASMPVALNGRRMAGWSSFLVNAGDILEIGQSQSGCRGYIAVTGGFEVPLVMGSRSCYPGAGIGGLGGRSLQKDDELCRGGGALVEPRQLPAQLIPEYQGRILLRAIAGPQDDCFEEGLEIFFTVEFTVSHEASRMGYRLTGPEIRQKPGYPASIVSEASLPGGVQIPPNGQPIILLAEQTVGGYAKIATVISSDLWRIGQAIPGDLIRFQRVDLITAYAVKRQRQQILDHIRTILDQTDTVR
jgi:antagonist of KipI